MNLNKKDEYFLAIAKVGIHSFIMLGVVKDCQPQLLARVGNNDDVNRAISLSSSFSEIKKNLISGNLARLKDEGVFREENHIANINYQAYEINYEQVKEFLGMIAEIEQRQLKNPEIQTGIKRLVDKKQRSWEAKTQEMEQKAKKMSGAESKNIMSEVTRRKELRYEIEDEEINCFVPIKENGDVVNFELKKLKECEFLTTEEIKAKTNSEISSGVQQIHLNNTCRTSSKNIVEAILGFVTDVSSYFFIAPKYQSKLIAGQPSKISFYILPSPPNCAKVGKGKEAVLKKIYKRLEEIPKLNPESSKTRKKFDALKSLYKDIAGENHLSAKALLGKILEHEDKNQNSLFEKRSPNFLSKLFSLSSSTKRMFDDMEKSLKKIMSSQEVKEVCGKFKMQKDNPIEENQGTEVKPNKF